MSVLVFKTSVQSAEGVRKLRPELNKAIGKGKWNFALDDCDKILRISSDSVTVTTTMNLLQRHGFECIELED